MASSSSPPQLQLSLPVSSFKRSFEQFDVGYVESPSTIIQSNEQPIDGTGSTASSSSTTTSPDGDENRRKRARSASTLHEAEDRSSDASSSTLSSFDSDASDSFSQSSSSQAPRHHLLLDLGLGRTLGSSVALGLGIAASELQLGGRATSEPPPRIPTPELLESEDVDMPDIDIGFSIDENHDDQEEPTSPADNVRRSVDRFNAFDRHISVLRSSSPPVIPLPTSLSSHHASLSPPTLPPLPLVDLGLDPEDDEDGDEPEHIPSTIPTNMSTSTPPRLDLNLPPTTSLSSGPSSPHVATDEAPTQFRERLDSALTGIGGGVLHFEAPISPTDERVDGPSFDRYLEPAQQALASTSAGSSSNPGGSGSASPYYPRPFAESPLFEWTVPHALDWDTPTFSARSPGGSASADATRLPPSPWRRHRNNSNDNTTTTPDTTVADLRRLLGTPLPSRLLPRPPSLAAPATTTSSLDAVGLDVDLDDAYLDLRMPPNARAWESAVDRARTLHQQRERGRERERREREERQRVHERERQIAREREEETERERENPWRLDSIWGTNAGVESFPSARPRPRESSLTRMRRELAEDELALEITRRRAVERQLRQTLDRDRILDRRLEDEQPERGQSVSRAARYLESGLVDPREAPSAPSSNLRPPLDTSNPFSVSWTSRRAARPVADDASASTSRIRQSRSSSQSREGPTDWLGRMERDELSPDFDLLDEWLSEHPPPRSVTPAAGPSRSSAYDELEASDFPRRNPEGSSASSGDLWRSRATGTWQPRLALSPQSTAQPTRTATHARAQSIPSSSLSSATAQPSLHRLRQRLHEQPRVGASTSLVSENAAAIRRREARTELMERLSRTMNMDIDLSDPESDYDFLVSPQRTRNPQPAAERDVDRDMDSLMDSDDDEPHISRPVGRLPLGALPPASRPFRFRSQRQGDPSHSPPLSLRIPSGSVRSRSAFEQESAETPTASSSGLNSRRALPTQTRRPIVRLRQHPIGGGELSPPPSATASVDRRHVSWEAPFPSRDNGVSSTLQYLSALSHGFDSQALSISDLAHTITTNEALRSPQWGENSESPFSSLFTRSAPSPTRNGSSSGSRAPEIAREVPSLPPPDLGGDFDRGDDLLRSANADGARGAPSSSSELPTLRPPIRPPTPPSHNPYTGPFRLTMQRREEAFRRAERRLPDAPSIPPLYFGDFGHSSTSSRPQERSESGNTRHASQRHTNFHLPPIRNEAAYANSRLADAERRLFNYRGPPSSSQTLDADGDPRRFFPSRPVPTSSTSPVERLRETEEQRPRRYMDPEEQPQPQPRRYSATEMHNVLARQARLAGSRLAPDLPSPSTAYRAPGGDTDPADLSHNAFSTSRAQLISRYHHERVEVEARETSSSSSSPWAALPPRRPRDDTNRADLEHRRRRAMGARPLMSEAEPPQLRHRAFRDPSFHMMYGFPGGTARFRRRALGDYVRDEDFDASYENLLSLSSVIGDAKPKSTPEHVLTSLDTASYKDWATTESDQRCPICLDDYQPSDPVMKLGDCRHWLHKECLEQWLKGASTCPVCRKDVKGKGKRPHFRHHGSDSNRRRDGDGPDGPGGPGPSGSGSGGGGGIPHVNWINFLTD